MGTLKIFFVLRQNFCFSFKLLLVTLAPSQCSNPMGGGTPPHKIPYPTPYCPPHFVGPGDAPVGFRRKMEELEWWLADAVSSAGEYTVCVIQLRLSFFQLPSAINTSNNRTMWARHWPSFIVKSER